MGSNLTTESDKSGSLDRSDDPEKSRKPIIYTNKPNMQLTCLKKCIICKKDHIGFTEEKYCVITGYTGRCLNCAVSMGETYDQLSTKITKRTMCFYCEKVTNCHIRRRIELLIENYGVCPSCFNNYSHKDGHIICTKTRNNKCDICKVNSSNKDNVQYTEAVEKNYCMLCFIKAGLTKKQLRRNVHCEESNKLDVLIKYYDKDRTDIPKQCFSVDYDEWQHNNISCRDENCSHTACDECLRKHRLLVNMKVYTNRVDMCSKCWLE